MKKYRVWWGIASFILLSSACAPTEAAPLVIYSGRSESLVQPLVDLFIEETGLEVQVRYGGTAEMAATLLEEGANSPADIFWAQDPGGLGAVAAAGLLAELPPSILEVVPAPFRSPEGDWVGISGRTRVIVYNTDALSEAGLPAEIWDFTDPQWAGKLGWAPTNGSFQVMVTAMRQTWGEEKTRQWLEGVLANRPLVYENNTAIVAAVGTGEVEVGFVNHYYLYRFLAEEGEGFPARNYFQPGGGPGSLMMIAGAGILESSANTDTAFRFLRYLLDTRAQEYFAVENYEYPMLAEVALPAELPPLDALKTLPINLADLEDLAGTVSLLQSVGALP